MARKPETVRIELLGGFRVSVGSRTVGEDGWRLRKAASLVKLLALALHHRLHRERVMERLRPGLDPKAAANNLRYALYIARRVLEPSSATASRHLRLRGDWLALCPDGPLWVDAEAFEEAAARARRAREPAAYRAALNLYAGDLLPQDRYEAWAEDRREELRRSYLALLLELAGLHEERGDLEPAIKALGRAVASEPAHEEAHVGLMRLYAASGRYHEAIVQYQRLRKALSEELDAEPGDAGRRLYEEVLLGRSGAGSSRPEGGRAPDAPPPDEPPRHNLPLERTSFVGREDQVVEVERLLAMTRLLTLTGTGGCGKTRLALKVARNLAGAYPDGAWLVELAARSEEALVPQAVAAALGVREQPDRPLTATLKDSLSEKNLLLVLDNCEHLVDAAASLVEGLLDSCPGLRVLATSREALNVAGELTWWVPSLSVPDPRRPPAAEELARSESARLFLERARYRDPAFALSPRNARAVAEICGRLDGIPLAIELAAAKVGALSAEQIAGRLGDSLRLLGSGSRTAPPRQQTLRGTLDWSHELLSEPERDLFYRLSVFAGGWTLEAAEAVGAGEGIEEGEVLELLSGLVDKSMVVAEAGAEGALRYRMLEPVRQYGLERLEESGEAEEVRRRHAALFLALAERAGPQLKGRRQAAWLERLEREHDNLRAATRWLLEEGETETVARLAWALWFFWHLRGHQGEGYRYTGEVLEKGGALPTGMRAKVFYARGVMSYAVGSFDSTMRLFEESSALFRQVGDKPGLAMALGGVGVGALQQGDMERATALMEESLELFREAGDKWGVSSILGYLGIIPLNRGDYARATRHFEEALALSGEIGDRHSGYLSLYNLALIARAQGDHERAVRLYVEGLRLVVEMGDKADIAYCLEGLAELVGAGGEPERAARLFGASEALLEAVVSPLYVQAQDRASIGRAVDALRSRLGETPFRAAWAQGRAMTLEEAVEYALSGEEPQTTTLVPQEPPADGQTAGLTRRQREVAVLVARGLSNRQIAAELVISEHTVATHVRKILKKLGLCSRIRIAAWIMEQGPLP